MGINDSGQVTGMIYGTGSQQAYVGTPAAVTVIPLPPGATVANTNSGAINNQGSVVGFSDAGGWIWDLIRGTILLNSLVPTGWNLTGAVSISNNGLILAQASENGGPS